MKYYWCALLFALIWCVCSNLRQALEPVTNLAMLQGYVRCIMDNEKSRLINDSSEGHIRDSDTDGPWEHFFTDEGHGYWFNNDTGISQWDRP